MQFTSPLGVQYTTDPVTFAGASGLGVWGKAGLRTNGQYAFVSLRNVSGVGYVLHGDAQV